MWQINALVLSTSYKDFLSLVMIPTILSNFLAFIFFILSIAFFTLLERKVLGYAQLRKGPNKINFAGIPQPLADALKLFLKERALPVHRNKIPYLAAPIFSLILALLLWSLYISPFPIYFIRFGLLFFLALSRISVYGTLISGWASNSKYALLGALRAVAQTISYEVSIALILLTPIVLISSLNLNDFSLPQTPIPLLIFLAPFFVLWFITTLAETNRAPFDFAEGESELVSGFNVEYRGTIFAFIFIAEYIRILLIRFLTALLFWGTIIFRRTFLILTLWLKTALVAFFFLWARATLPRIRYDLLMRLTWKVFLPLILPALFFLSALHPFLP